MERADLRLSFASIRLLRMCVTVLDHERCFYVEREDRAKDALVGEAVQIDTAQTGSVGIDGVLRDRTEAATPAHRRFHHDDVLQGRVDPNRFQLLLITGHRLVRGQHEVHPATAQDRGRPHVDRDTRVLGTLVYPLSVAEQAHPTRDLDWTAM